MQFGGASALARSRAAFLGVTEEIA